MSKLEDRIRESHRRTFPATPPQGGWDRIHQELNRPVGGNRPRTLFGWGFVSGLLAGGLAVYLLVSLTGGSPSAPAMATAPCPEVSSPERAALATGVSSDEASMDVAGAVTRTERSSTPASDAERDVNTSDQRSEAPEAIEPETLAATPSSDPAIEANSDVLLSAGPTMPLRVTPLLPAAARLFSDHPVTSRGGGNYASRFTPVAPKAFTPATDAAQPEKKWTFHRVPKGTSMRPRWELGGSLLVVPARQRYYGFALDRQASRPGQETRIVSSPDGPDTLYRGQVTGIADRTHTFNFRSLFLEVGHQFPNGIRLSGGLLGIVSNTRNLGNRLGVLEDLRSSGEATEIITSSERRLIGTLSFQYTFFRRRRFRLSAGLGIVTFLGTRNAETSFIAVGEEVPFQRQTSFSYNNIPFFRTTPLPSLQVQYQISRHLSLTGDLVPGLGIGLRYGIASSKE
ncbi:MAG: hypothetical protein WA952_14260 [Lewinella sp.]